MSGDGVSVVCYECVNSGNGMFAAKVKVDSLHAY